MTGAPDDALDGTGRQAPRRGHGPDHSHADASSANRSRLRLVLGITVVVLLVEVVGGLVSGSLALLADAAHMLTDVGGQIGRAHV